MEKFKTTKRACNEKKFLVTRLDVVWAVCKMNGLHACVHQLHHFLNEPLQMHAWRFFSFASASFNQKEPCKSKCSLLIAVHIKYMSLYLQQVTAYIWFIYIDTYIYVYSRSSNVSFIHTSLSICLFLSFVFIQLTLHIASALRARRLYDVHCIIGNDGKEATCV